MSQFTQKSGKWVYQPNQTAPFRLSKSKVDLFLNCPKCFYQICNNKTIYFKVC